MQIALPVALGQVSSADDGEATVSQSSSGEPAGDALFTLGPEAGTTPESETLALAKASPLALGKGGAQGGLLATTEPVDSSGPGLPRAVEWIGDTEAMPASSPRIFNGILPSASRLSGGPNHGEVPAGALLRSGAGRVPGEVAKSPVVLPSTGQGLSDSVVQNSGSARDADGNAGLGERILAGAGGSLEMNAAERPSTGQKAMDAELTAEADRSTLAAKSDRVSLARGAGEGAVRSGVAGAMDATPGSSHSPTGAVEESALWRSRATASMAVDDVKAIGDGAQRGPDGVRHEAGPKSDRPITRMAPQSGPLEGGARAEGTPEEAMQAKLVREGVQRSEGVLKSTRSRAGDWDKMVSDGKVPQPPVASDARRLMSGPTGHPSELVGKVSGRFERSSEANTELPRTTETAPTTQVVQNQTRSRATQGSAASAGPDTAASGLVYSPLAMSAELGETLDGAIALDRAETAGSGDARRELTANAGSAMSHLARAATRQIADSIRFPMDGSIEIKLSPEELGRVKLSMLPGEAGTMTVQLTVERADTLELLRRYADLLANDLRDAGYSGLEFSFSREGDGEPSSERAEDVRIADNDKAADGVPITTRAKRDGAPSTSGVDLRL